ncbi:MAG: glycine zipper 2TM domain-containing protein [Rhodospirillales bacterium]|nr:glycine zipper 2TM domain-containing protein [Rhodospirillales bacterium]
MTKKISGVAALAVLVLAACAEGQEKQTFGAIVGAGVGALVGSQIGSGNGRLASIAVGTLGGAWLGSEAGKSLDEADKLKAMQTAQNTLEFNQSGQTSSWNNPDTGNSGTYTPTNTYQSAGKDCRDFESSVTVDGKTEPATGRACREEDGTWKIIQ